jgi:hypothetical protein
MGARRFNHEITLNFLKSRAEHGNFTSFIQVTRHYGIADQDWPHIYVLLYRHLDQFVGFCVENKTPPLSVLVVARYELKRGLMSARQMKRLALALHKYGYDRPLTKLRVLGLQNECFYWARQAPMEERQGDGFVKPAFSQLRPAGTKIYTNIRY